MEKKRTKIAYFTAVGVFLVLLVVLGLTYRETPLPTVSAFCDPFGPYRQFVLLI